MGWLVRNWHLKLGAAALAMILYTGFVYSGSFTDESVAGIRVDVAGQPADWIRLGQPQNVTISYRVAAETAESVQPQSFVATVDFGDYDPDLAAQPQSLRVNVRPTFEGIRILSIEPAEITVSLDLVETKQVPVRVDRGEVPPGLEAGTPVLSVNEVTARGAASLLRRVDHAQASVSIEPSGVDVNAPVDLQAVDVSGIPVPSVELDPSSVTVQIDVQAIETTKTVPVRPVLEGTPRSGYEIGAVTVDPPVVTLLGMPDALSGITEVRLQPIGVEDATAPLELTGTYVVPKGTRLAEDSPDPTVSVQVVQSVAERTLVVGILCRGLPNDWACLPNQSQVALTVSGPASLVAGLKPADLAPVIDASDFTGGEQEVQLVFPLPNGVELVDARPSSVTVTVVPPATPTPPPG